MASKNEKYIVSARRYRPQTFDEIVGQEHVVTTLKNAIKSGHLAHAYLFSGPRGVGKTTAARIMARTVNCENPKDNMEACGECETCKTFKNNNALNIFELDAASNNSVEDIRRLNEQVCYAPQHGKYKIYIIDEAHMLSASAFNAFLKTLEEPPSYAIFILATTEKHKILPTILSRCQVFDFKRINAGKIVGHLTEIAEKKDISVESTALHVIAQKSEGCMRDALSMMDRLADFSQGTLTYKEVIEHLNVLDADSYFQLSEMLLSKDVGAALLFLDELLQKGFEGNFVLNGFSNHFRNLLLCRDKRMTKILEIPDEHKKKFFEQANLIPEAYIVSALSILNEAELNYKMALDKKLHVELCLIRLCYLNDLIKPDNLAPTSPSNNEVKKNLNPNKTKETHTEPKKSSKSNKSNKSNKTTTTTAGSNQTTSTPSQYATNSKSTDKKNPAINVFQEQHPPLMPPPSNTDKKTTTSKPKMSANLLNDLQSQNDKQDQEDKKELTPEYANALFEDLKKELTAKNRTHGEQLKMMTVHFESPEELHLICNSELNLSYGKVLCKEYRAYIRKHIGNQTLRVIPKVNPNAKTNPDNSDQPKSKQEIFEEFMKKNPYLKELKNKLHLSVDY